MSIIPQEPSFLIEKISAALKRHLSEQNLFDPAIVHSRRTSAVLFLLGLPPAKHTIPVEPCLILNKRSEKVKQPGDLCFPGGSMATRIDSQLAKLLYLPGSPLKRWPLWPIWFRQRQAEARILAALFATGLRETFEEMRLNPLRVKFLGPLPPQKLVTFDRKIYPLVCWFTGLKPFKTNREVEKIIYIPLKELLIPENYARYRIYLTPKQKTFEKELYKESLGFLYKQPEKTELLWGATLRMTMELLKLVFDFTPPRLDTLPVVEGFLGKNYLTGTNKAGQKE